MNAATGPVPGKTGIARSGEQPVANGAWSPKDLSKTLHGISPFIG